KFTWQFLEQYPAAQDCAYKFLVCEDKPGMPRPAIDSWDTEYMQENRWDEESASFVPVETESDPMNVTFDKLAPEVQNAVMVKFDTCENITVDMAIDAQELLQEDVATFDGHIVEALMKTPEINAMYPERKLFAIGWVKHKCNPGAKWPEIQAELRNWKKRQDAERKETGKYTSVVDLARARVNRQHTENSAEKINPATAAIRREYKQTWKTLDRELASYLWPGDTDPGSIDGNILRWAENEVIAKDREDWKRISASMRKQPDAIRYNRQTIFGLVRERPLDIHKDPVALNKYITEYLATKGVFEDEETDQNTADILQPSAAQTDAVETEVSDTQKNESTLETEPSVEREGPFYFLFTDKDGEKYGRANKLSGLEKALALGATEITKEEYFARKNGTYSGSQQNTGASDTTAQPEPVKVTADEVNKIMQAANISQPDANQLLAVSRGEFVAGISDPNDPKWVKGIETRDSVSQNQQESEQNGQKAEQNSPNALQNEPETKQPEPVVQQEPEIVCNACGQSGGDNCPDCGAVMGDTTYQETFNEENLDESQEKDPEEMEGPEHPHNENAGSDPHRDCSDETGEVADPVIAGDIEPGIYYGISNENYHAGPGVSKSQLDDIADTPALYLWRKNAPVDTTKTKTLDLGTAFHCRVLEPEEFSNRFIVAPEFNRRTTAGKEEEKAFLMECASTGKTVITAEEGRKIELMYQSVMALPLGQWLVESAGHAESSIYWEDPETGILCRCRPDKIIPEFHWIMDVKTTADIQRFKTAYYDYRYHVQDAFYSDGYEAQFGVLPTFVFLVASTTVECGRYPVEIFMMGEEAKLAGQQEYHRNLRTLADCLNTDEWPAIKTLSLPRWAKEYAND
ncbi:TPA: PD-(D/E)XK nuclease-like domain-containing protein, partial [Escherichia coli]